ncbi:MAG: ABC transporter ATP-binding protein [Candidatus Hydrogenedentota bacterium]|nr:MAG: ABC transporter ATP-binding protein [Candidatus Hydrogenedentota bacterium]
MKDGEAVRSEGRGEVLLTVRDLVVEYPVYGGVIKRVVDRVAAVRGVSFELRRGEVVGLVGESGCGKTTIAKALLGLAPIRRGVIRFGKITIPGANASEERFLKQRIQIVFQDPFSSLDPRMSVFEIVSEGLRVHEPAERKIYRQRVKEVLEAVGLERALMDRYPHEFSGGQRQRIAIARALVLRPEILLLDESVSALDVLVQAQILNLLERLKKEFGLTYLFITHDLGVVEYLADRILVMHDGRIVEAGDVEEIFDRPRCDYTKRLLAARP